MEKPPNLKVDEAAYEETLERYKEEIEEEIEIHPDLAMLAAKEEEGRPGETPIRRRATTLHEGEVLYLKYWNYWVRAGVRADDRVDIFFPDFENTNARIFNLIADIGVTTAPSSGEVHIWEKIRTVWAWLLNNVSYSTAYSTIATREWPSIDEFAAYYETHGNLVWGTCFTKAHLFASLLGRVGIPRWRIMSVSAHHTFDGNPPTASHVYVAVYVNERWYYLDPTFVFAVPVLPEFDSISSVGLLPTMDYVHPFTGIPIPLSGFTRIPMLDG